MQAILAPGGVTTALLYDYSGNMIQKRVTSAGQDDIQKYVLDDVSNIVSVQQGAAVTSILDGRGPDEIMAIVQAGSPVFPLLDQISSESAFTDGSGNVVGREFYEPFGAATTSGTVSLFAFTGRLQINTGLYYYRARFYDSNTGRFLSEDPIGLLGTDANLYRYVGNSPVSFVDYSGTTPEGLKLTLFGGGLATAGVIIGSIACPPCAALAIGLGGAGVAAGIAAYIVDNPDSFRAVFGSGPTGDPATSGSTCPNQTINNTTINNTILPAPAPPPSPPVSTPKPYVPYPHAGIRG